MGRTTRDPLRCKNSPGLFPPFVLLWDELNTPQPSGNEKIGRMRSCQCRVEIHPVAHAMGDRVGTEPSGFDAHHAHFPGKGLRQNRLAALAAVLLAATAFNTSRREIQLVHFPYTKEPARMHSSSLPNEGGNRTLPGDYGVSQKKGKTANHEAAPRHASAVQRFIAWR